MRVTTPARLVGVAVAALMLATACASPEDGSADSGQTRTITDAMGDEVEVPEHPEKIVALSEQDLDSLLALGVTPVGTVNGRGQDAPPAYLGDDAAEIDVVGDVAKPTIDKVVELEPDLVLYGGVTDEKQLDQLRELVPATVVTYDLEDDWKTAFETIAEAVNASDEYDSWMSEYDTLVDETTEKMGDNAGDSVSIIRWNPDGPAIMQNEAFSSLVVQDLGLERPADQQESGYAHTDPLSLENLPRIDADWIFVGTLQPGSEEALTEAKEDAAFSELEAVENDRFIEVDGTLWTSRGGPLASEKVIDDVTDKLGA